jgi:hypothetical protein
MRSLVRSFLTITAALSLGRTPLPAQDAPAAGAPTYATIAAGLRDLRPEPARAARVSQLVLQRDAGRFTLEDGVIYVLSPVAGRAVGAVFEGHGMFAFTAPLEAERDQIQRFLGQPEVAEPFTALVLLFADTTLAELERRLQFGTEAASSDAASAVRNALQYLTDDESKALDPDLLRPFLNGETNAYFYAHIVRRGDPLMFVVDPYEVEGIALLRRAKVRHQRVGEVVAEFRPAADRDTPRPDHERTREVAVRGYTIETWLPRSALGSLSFAARARLELTAEQPVGPWIPLDLYPELTVDSARWADGRPATVVKVKRDATMWVALPDTLRPGASADLEVFYQGDLIDRFVSFFFIKSSAAWYPRPLEGRSLATFDLTYHSPASYLLASVGERVAEQTDGNVVTSHWVARSPTRNASFNIGQFKPLDVPHDSGPAATLLYSDEAHRAIGKLFGELGSAKVNKDAVAQDIGASLQFFGRMFGDPPERTLYATEIPYLHGEAFPGLLHLSWATFEPSADRKGEEDVFRAHEVAHQWWGIGVDFATYHDQWLSEGFAQFSALWYMQVARKNNDLYFGMLRRWRDDIFRKRDAAGGEDAEVGPISLGYRTASSQSPDAYDLMVYRKGAWVLHMLRVLMLDLRTVKEDAFTGLLRDFYASYAGRRASTADFQRMVEQRIEVPMGWFFDEWVGKTAVPTYTVSWRKEAVEGGRWRVRLRVRQSGVPDSFRMLVPISVDLGNNRSARMRVDVHGPVTELKLPLLLPSEPKELRFNELEGVLCEVKLESWKS